MKVILDESDFGMKVILDEIFWSEKRHFHPNLDESVSILVTCQNHILLTLNHFLKQLIESVYFRDQRPFQWRDRIHCVNEWFIHTWKRECVVWFWVSSWIYFWDMRSYQSTVRKYFERKIHLHVVAGMSWRSCSILSLNLSIVVHFQTFQYFFVYL